MKAFPHKGTRTVQHISSGTGMHSVGTKEIETNEAGMDLRDYFAAKAMQGITANNRWNISEQIDRCAIESYKMADAMMKARKTTMGD